jgi:hypothetical protein
MTRRSRILSNLLLSLPFAAGLLFAAPHASAQNTASFSIPFAFSANNQTVPAGSYSAQLQSDRFLCLRNLKTGSSQIVMVRPDDSGRMTNTGRLVFQRYGRRSYLKQVWIGGTSTHSELVVRPKIEQELAQQTPPTVSSVEIASK